MNFFYVLISLLKSSRNVSIVEQAMLSSANFLAALILARTLPKEEYGIFTLAYTAAIFLQGFQRALLSIPMVVYAASPELLAENGVFWRRLQAGLVVVVTLSLLLLLALFMLVEAVYWIQAVLWITLIITVPIFYYEFFRRWLIQEGKISQLLTMAVAYAAVYVGGVLVVVRNHQAALPAALLMAGGAVVATLIGYRRATSPKPRPTLTFSQFLRDLWMFGRWSVLSHVAFTGYNSLTQFVLAFFAGPTGVAMFQATRNTVQPVQTLIMAIDNVDKPRASKSLLKGGLPAMAASLRNTSRTLILLGGGYLLFLGVMAPHVLHVLYDGRYDDASFETRSWLPVVFLMLLGQPFESGLYLLKRPDLLFKGRIWAALAGIIVALVFVPVLGVSGALLGLGAGWLVSTVFAFIQLRALVGEASIRA